PRPAMHVDERGERRGWRALWAIDARQHVGPGAPRERSVRLLDLVRRRLIEANVHTCPSQGHTWPSHAASATSRHRARIALRSFFVSAARPSTCAFSWQLWGFVVA